MLGRRNHYIKITMRQEPHTHCLYRTNRGKMRVGGKTPLGYVHPNLATPTTEKEERVCYSATLRLRGTVCPLDSVRACFAISRIQMCYVKAQLLLTDWSDGSWCGSCFCGHSQQAWHFSLVFGVRYHVDIKQFTALSDCSYVWQEMVQ
jgi:hypothetical protein